MNRLQQPPLYLFGKTALEHFAAFMDERTLFAFDLDGTLAPIVSDPSQIEIPQPVQRALAALADVAPVAIITGRSRSDARKYLHFTPRYLIGNHGAEGLPGWSDREADFVHDAESWQRQLAGLLPPEKQSGIVIENKGPTIALHYRRAVDIRQAQDSIAAALAGLEPRPRRVGGKFVENLLPEDAPDKALALQTLMRRENISKSVFAGDDETDEDIFRIGNPNLFTVRVGRKPQSLAAYYLRSPQETGRMLRIINVRLVR